MYYVPIHSAYHLRRDTPYKNH